MRYRKKPSEIDAYKWFDDEPPLWVITARADGVITIDDNGRAHVATPEGIVKLEKGDYVVRSEDGTIFVMSSGYLESTYERVEG